LCWPWGGGNWASGGGKSGYKPGLPHGALAKDKSGNKNDGRERGGRETIHAGSNSLKTESGSGDLPKKKLPAVLADAHFRTEKRRGITVAETKRKVKGKSANRMRLGLHFGYSQKKKKL